jgi:hypothetical protein
MTNLRNLLMTFATLAIFLGPTSQAATVAITLETPMLVAAPGQTVIFQGVLTNTSGADVFLNSCNVNPPANSVGDCGAGLFFDNAPFTLGAGEVSGPYPLFSVTVDPNYSGPFGLLSGSFDVVGGIASDSEVTLGSQVFQVDVVPEPGTAALFGLALPAVFVLRRRAMRS